MIEPVNTSTNTEVCDKPKYNEGPDKTHSEWLVTLQTRIVAKNISKELIFIQFDVITTSYSILLYMYVIICFFIIVNS